MAKSDVEACNIALARIGITMAIASLTERSKEAIQCLLVYDMVRDRVLADGEWPFARKSSALQLTGDPTQRWMYSYQYPIDCLRIVDVFPAIPTGMTPQEFRLWSDKNRLPYKVGNGESDNTVILCDTENAVIDYVSRITNPARFDATFTSCFAWALAAELAIPLAKGVDYARNAQAQYRVELEAAYAKAFNEEGQELDDLYSSFVAARG